MGILSDILEGKRDFIHGDPDNMHDLRTWPYSKKKALKPQKDEEDEKMPSTSEEADEITQNFDSD